MSYIQIQSVPNDRVRIHEAQRPPTTNKALEARLEAYAVAVRDGWMSVHSQCCLSTYLGMYQELRLFVPVPVLVPVLVSPCCLFSAIPNDTPCQPLSSPASPSSSMPTFKGGIVSEFSSQTTSGFLIWLRKPRQHSSSLSTKGHSHAEDP